MSSKLFMNLRKDSFTYKVILLIKEKFIKSLNNSLFLSTFLKDENIYRKNGLLVIFEERLYNVVAKILKNIRHILYGFICESVLINMAVSIGKTIRSDIYRFWITTIGTSILVFGVLSMLKGVYSTGIFILFIIIGSVLLILGWLDVELDRIFSVSKFITAIKNIFDYNS